jgi:hypothetical protein
LNWNIQCLSRSRGLRKVPQCGQNRSDMYRWEETTFPHLRHLYSRSPIMITLSEC